MTNTRWSWITNDIGHTYVSQPRQPRPGLRGRLPAMASRPGRLGPGGAAPPGAVWHGHTSAVGRPAAFHTDWLPILPVLAYVARFSGDRFHRVAFTPPFTCDNGGALSALWRLGMQKPCNMRDFWQIPTSDWMKREGARRRGPRRAKKPRRKAGPTRMPPCRPAANSRPRRRSPRPRAPARLPARLHAFVLLMAKPVSVTLAAHSSTHLSPGNR